MELRGTASQNLQSFKWYLSSTNILREGNEEALKARQNCRKQISGGRFDSPLKQKKSSKTSIVMPLAKKGICVFSWIYSGKNAYALFGHQATWKGKSALQRSLYSHRSKGPWWKKCQNQKGRTGHGEMAALLHWWAGCKLPKATLEKCTVCPETSKKHSLETIGYFHSWVYKLGKLKISKTQEPQSLGLLSWQEPPLHFTLNILGKKKMIKKLRSLGTMEYHSAMKSTS